MDIGKKLWVGIFLVFCFLNMKAQDKWTFEFRPNLDFPTTKIENEKIKTGFGFDATISYSFIKELGIYAGWGWNSYRAENILEIGDIDLDETGYTFGLQFIQPILESSLSYFVRLGGIFAHLEIENDAGEISASSDHKLGFEISGGLQLSHQSNFSLRPQIGYRSLAADFSQEDAIQQADLDNFFFGIGIAKTF